MLRELSNTKIAYERPPCPQEENLEKVACVTRGGTLPV